MGALLGYGHLVLVLVGCMLFVALVMNPLIVFWKTRRNPIAGVHLPARKRHHAFFTRSSGGQHPVTGTVPASEAARGHLLGLDPARGDHQHGGRRVTISVMTSRPPTRSGHGRHPTALLLSVVSALAAAPRRGRRSLLLIRCHQPARISADVAMQVVASASSSAWCRIRGDRAQLVDRCAVHRGRLSGGRRGGRAGGRAGAGVVPVSGR